MLQNLKIDFNSLNPGLQKSFFLEYSERRHLDLLAPPTIVKKKRVSKGRKAKEKKGLITVSLEQLKMLKKLGLVT